MNAATAEHGLAVTGGAISTTGIAGLTLGGGLGWLMAKHGLAADNLPRVELVTADGEIIEVTAESEPDLFWALRGGGGNFGVATAFTYRAPPVDDGHRRVDRASVEGPEMLRFYRDAVADASDDLTVFAGLVHAPDGSGMKLAAMVPFHTGAPEEAERELAPFKSGALRHGRGRADALPGHEHDARRRLSRRGAQLLALELLERAHGRPHRHGVERFAAAPSPMTAMLLEHFHGAVTRVAVTTLRCRIARRAGTSSSRRCGPTRSTRTRTSRGRETYAALAAAPRRRRWLNYLGDDQGDDAVRAAYGPNYERLLEIKRRYDPENVFHHNHNIVP